MTKTIDISKALSIDGWMSEEELVWLAEQAQKHTRIVEIGSYLGRSTRALGDNADGVVFAIDDWHGPRDVALDRQERRSCYTRFCDNTGDLIERGILKPLRLDHAVVPDFGQVDMVFIDGDHDYENIKRDINTWLPRLSKGGLISGHDFGVGGDSVAKAVCEINCSPSFSGHTSIWFWIT